MKRSLIFLLLLVLILAKKLNELGGKKPAEKKEPAVLLETKGTPRHPGAIETILLETRGTPRHPGAIETILLSTRGTPRHPG